VAAWAGLTVYVLLFEIEFSRGKGWDHINRFNPATFFVPVPSQDLDFKCHMSWSFVFVFIEFRMKGDCSFC